MSTLLVNNIKTFSGDTVTISGSNILVEGKTTLGDETTDHIIFNARASSSLIPLGDNQFDLGTTSSVFRTLFADQVGENSSQGYVSNLFSKEISTSAILASGSNNGEITISGSIIPGALSGSNTYTIGKAFFAWDEVHSDSLFVRDIFSTSSIRAINIGSTSSFSAPISSSLLAASSNNALGSSTQPWNSLHTLAGKIDSLGELTVRTISASALPSRSIDASSGEFFTLSGSQIFSSSAFPGGSNPVFVSGEFSSSLFVFQK